MQSLYADGGVLGVNPSPAGGVWAWVLTEDGRRVTDGRGIMVPEVNGERAILAAHRVYYKAPPGRIQAVIPWPRTDSTGYMISNNHAEVMAVVDGLAHQPDGWTGEVVSDSTVALNRVSGRIPLNPHNLPLALIKQLAEHINRLGPLQYRHVKGHPTKADLRRGRNVRGQPVDVFQAWCDTECSFLARSYRDMLYLYQVLELRAQVNTYARPD